MKTNGKVSYWKYNKNIFCERDKNLPSSFSHLRLILLPLLKRSTINHLSLPKHGKLLVQSLLQHVYNLHSTGNKKREQPAFHHRSKKIHWNQELNWLGCNFLSLSLSLSLSLFVSLSLSLSLCFSLSLSLSLSFRINLITIRMWQFHNEDVVFFSLNISPIQSTPKLYESTLHKDAWTLKEQLYFKYTLIISKHILFIW